MFISSVLVQVILFADFLKVVWCVNHLCCT